MNYTDATDNNNGQFRDGDVTLGQKGTVVNADFLNAVQDELCKLIEDQGMDLDKEDDTQFSQALESCLKNRYKKTLINKHVVDSWTTDKNYFATGITAKVRGFIDLTFSVTITSSTGSGTFYLGIHQDNLSASGDVYFGIPFSGSAVNQEFHRVVKVNADGDNLNFSLYAQVSGTGTVNAVVDVAGYVDNSNY